MMAGNFRRFHLRKENQAEHQSHFAVQPHVVVGRRHPRFDRTDHGLRCRAVLYAPAAVVSLGEMYDAGTCLGTDARLSLRGRERVALTGPNGVGKATLLEALVPPAAVPVGICAKSMVPNQPTTLTWCPPNNAVLMSLAGYEAVDETAYLLRTPANAARLLGTTGSALTR